MSENIEVEAVSAPQISEDSWLLLKNNCEWYVKGYNYATTQLRAIPVLAKLTPEELYFAVTAILRGADPEALNTIEGGSQLVTLERKPPFRANPLATMERKY